MTTRAEDVLYQSLTDTDSLEYLTRETISDELIPNESMVPVVRWAISYFAQSGYTLAPSRESLFDTWGNHIGDAGVTIIEDDIDTDTIQWALSELRSRYVTIQAQEFVMNFATDLNNAASPDRVSVLTEKSSELLSLLTKVESKSNEVSGSLGVARALADYQIRASRDEHVQGMTLGLEEVDNHILGVRDGELAIMAAAPKVGKSNMLVQVAINEWIQGRKTVLFTLENSVEMTYDRFITGLVNRLFQDELMTPLNLRDWTKGNASPIHERMVKDIQALMEENDNLMVISPEKGQRSVESMVAKAHILGADSILIDQLTFVEYEGPRNTPRWEQMKEVLHQLKSLISTGSRRLPCLLAHQINREGVQAADKLGHLESYMMAESAEVERTADLLMSLYQSKMDKNIDQATLQILAFRRDETKNWSLGWHLGEVMSSVRREISFNGGD